MSAPQQPIDLDPAPEAVVEFGPAPAERRRRWGGSGDFAQLAADPRLVPVTAALAAIAAFASLISEWQVTKVSPRMFGGRGADVLVPTDAADLGTLGTGYLIGLFGVVVAVVLTMFGPVAARRYARLTGLSVAGTLLALVLALAVSLGEQSRILSRLYALDAAGKQAQLAYGRGLWCALAAVLFALLALYLAGRHLSPARSVEDESGEAPPDEEPAAVWSWRRPPTGAEEDDDRGVAEPLELTVSPTKPFTPLTDDRDHPRS